jgi:hypothetical protein
MFFVIKAWFSKGFAKLAMGAIAVIAGQIKDGEIQVKEVCPPHAGSTARRTPHTHTRRLAAQRVALTAAQGVLSVQALAGAAAGVRGLAALGAAAAGCCSVLRTPARGKQATRPPLVAAVGGQLQEVRQHRQRRSKRQLKAPGVQQGRQAGVQLQPGRAPAAARRRGVLRASGSQRS